MDGWPIVATFLRYEHICLGWLMDESHLTVGFKIIYDCSDFSVQFPQKTPIFSFFPFFRMQLVPKRV